MVIYKTSLKLYLLIAVFSLGFIALITTNTLFANLIEDLENNIANQHAKTHIAEHIEDDLLKIESKFFQLAVLGSNSIIRKNMNNDIKKSISSLENSLKILEDGGSFKEVFSLNLVDQKKSEIEIIYEVDKKEVLFESMNIRPKLLKLKKAINEVDILLTQREKIKKSKDYKSFFSTIKKVKNYYKIAPSYFKRMIEDVNNLVYEANKELDNIQKEIEKDKKQYIRFKFLIVTFILIFVSIITIWINKAIEKTNSELKSSEKFQKIILDTQPNIVLVTNGKSLIMANKIMLKFFGNYESIEEYKEENGCICDFFEDINEEGYITKKYYSQLIWYKYVLSNPKKTFRVVMKKDHQDYYFGIKVSEFVVEDETLAVISLNDLTSEINFQNKLKIQNRQLSISTEKADRANKSKSEFLANMSHEIRTPLNAIGGFIDLLKDENLGVEQTRYLNIMDSSSKTLLKIIEDILDFSKIESGKIEIDKIDFDSKIEFEVLVHLFDARCSEKNILLSLSLDEKIPKYINTDPLRLKQIISNLIGNAIKFTSSGKKITIDIAYQDESLYISVIDEGIGIAEDKQQHIFDAFSQEDSSTTRKYGGTGLGLSISKKLVQLLGGELKLESKVGFGSRFYFDVPIKLGKERVKEQDKIENANIEGKKVLLVEDNKANQMFMTIVLKKIKLAFDIASDGLEAVEAFKNKKYDVILMDENMPNMSGIEATAKIIELEKEKQLTHTPIIALTANALKGDKEKFLNAGMDEYMTKPVDKKKLLEMLSRVIV